MRHVLGALALGVSAPVAAEDPLPDFATCMDREVARFERALRMTRAVPDAMPFEAGGSTRVALCGGIGIVLCDRSGEPVTCQKVLVARQEVLRYKVLAGLPAPDALGGQGGELAEGLYPALWALAHGHSAGPDCDETTRAFGAWCEAWAANDRLATVVHLWELARVLDVAAPAVEAGWARPLPPVWPRMRPQDIEE